MDQVEVEGLATVEKEILLAHSQDLVNKVKSESESCRDQESKQNSNKEYYYCNKSQKAAYLSASAVVTGTKKILDKSYESGYCIVRPPGHHANKDESLGFCLFNNAAVAAKVAMKEPHNLKKICIFDWDIHHGDGT